MSSMINMNNSSTQNSHIAKTRTSHLMDIYSQGKFCSASAKKAFQHMPNYGGSKPQETK